MIGGLRNFCWNGFSRRLGTCSFCEHGCYSVLLSISFQFSIFSATLLVRNCRVSVEVTDYVVDIFIQSAEGLPSGKCDISISDLPGIFATYTLYNNAAWPQDFSALYNMNMNMTFDLSGRIRSNMDSCVPPPHNLCMGPLPSLYHTPLVNRAIWLLCTSVYKNYQSYGSWGPVPTFTKSSMKLTAMTGGCDEPITSLSVCARNCRPSSRIWMPGHSRRIADCLHSTINCMTCCCLYLIVSILAESPVNPSFSLRETLSSD
jgi:hypothetical protein